MAVDGLNITEEWIRHKLNLQHSCLADVRSLILPGTYEGKICHLGISLKNFVRLKTLDLSHNALLTVQGIEHLEMLERLNLYYNRLSSLQDIFNLHRLQNLRELDLRLNPVVKKHPHYRLYFVHAMVKLRKLDDYPVRDRERKAALMHFTSEANLDHNQKEHVSTEDTTFRSSEHRIKAVERMMKTLSLLEGNEEAALNDVSRKAWNSENHQTPPIRSQNKCSPNQQGHPSGVIHLINDSECGGSFIQNQESTPKNSGYKNGANGRVRQGSNRVTFVSPILDSRHSVRSLTYGPVRGESIFTPHPTEKSSSQGDDYRPFTVQNQPQSSPNPVLHPPRLTFQSDQSREKFDKTSSVSERGHKSHKGAYRKPMELLLCMIEEHWSGKKENQQNRTFLMNMVKILTMMEKDVVQGEEEIQSLKDTIKALKTQSEVQEKEHTSEIETLTHKLQHAQESIETLNQQLKSVLEENVSLQKQLIKVEKKLLFSHLKKKPSMDNRGELAGFEELKQKETEEETRVLEGHTENEHTHFQQENYKTLIARNECLLQQLEDALMSS